ncbi:MAG: hypothetical protein ACLFS8_02765 [Clostridia bacterium]
MLLRRPNGQLGAGNNTVIFVVVAALVLGGLGYVVFMGAGHSEAQDKDEANALMLNEATSEWADDTDSDLSEVTMDDLVPEYIDEEPEDPYDEGRSYEPNDAGVWTPLGSPGE